jgi:outer membrane receptor for ferrienterochelin and colicin
MLKRIQVLIAILLVASFPVLSQETNSNIGGIVKGRNNEPLVGATITATHNPTGTVYRSISRSGGRFDIMNMTPGGPYTIVFSFVGFEEEKREEVFLALGQKSTYEISLADKSANLTEVVVASRRAPTAGKGGTETNIGREKIANMPTVSRSLNDFLRFTPQAKITGDGGISIGGQNNRYNAFYIDGAINNDVFGIAASGTNGGQANINPISIDAIDQFQVILSPYDASVGGFTGGGINAVTRSGTNTLQGSAWYYFRNENLAGRTPGNVPKGSHLKLADLDNKNFGFRIGGPIIKNKLFFFLLGEIQRDRRPQPFTYSDYRGGATIDSINKLVNFVSSKYGYDVGSFLDNPEKVNANRITAKIDWNLNSQNKLTLSYRYNDGERFNTTASNSTTVNFFNNGYIFPNKTHTATAELRTSFKRNASNRALVTYTNVTDDRNPIGDPFPRVTLRDGAGSIVFGTENFSTGNFLQQKNWTFYDAFKFYLGNNLITVGTDNLYSDAVNVFIRDFFGTYTYNSMNDFIQDYKPVRYQRSFSLLDNKSEKTTAAASAFKYINLAFFVNDEIKANDRLTLNLGIRGDKTEFLTDPLADPFFNDTAVAAISAHYDLRGARSGQISKVPWSISPRLGFVYRIPEENLTIRGGLGYFTGRMPLVWPGGVYNNNGISLGGIDLNPPTASQNINFRPDPLNQYTAADFGISIANSKGQIDLIEKTFRLPRLFRASFGIDKRLGKGWNLTLEAMYSKNINEIYYQHVNILPPIGKSVGPGSRNVYSFGGSPVRIGMRPGNVNPYTGVYLLYNNPDKTGFSYNYTVAIDKAFSKGFSFSLSYAYGSSIVTNEGTSSQNNSQWRFMETVNGKNYVDRTVSDFDLRHRFFAYASKRFSYSKNRLATTVTLVYNGQSGQPFSYVYNASMIGDDGRTSTNDLIYVPTSAELQAQTFTNTAQINGVVYTVAEQKQLLENYIQGDRYLRKRRGQFAERNGSRLPFTHILDLKLVQDINFKMGKKEYQVQITYDVYNFTHMLNHNWGRTYFLANDQYALIRFTGFTSASDLTPQYQFAPQSSKPWGLSTSTAPGISARFISQLGLRFNF